MDIFNLPKISKIALENATISSLIATPNDVGKGEDQKEEGAGENWTLDSKEDARSGRRKRGNINLWKDQGFASAKEWRMHVSGDLYRLNQKRKLRGKRELSEAEFKERFSATTMNEDESDRESISGSGEDDLSSTDDDDSSDEDCEGDFMHDSARAKEKQTKRKEKKEYEIATTSKTSESDAKILFQEEGEEKKCFAIYRAILLPDDVDFKGNASSAEANQTVAKALQNLSQDQGKPWVVILARGGHFAAAAFDAGKVFHGQNVNATIASTESVLKSKTFHRYVVRAKAGGRQSVKDQGGKTIKSAGSSMRRQNEMALVRDVTNAMENWKEEYLNVRFSFCFCFVKRGVFFRVMDKRIPESAVLKATRAFF